MNKKTISVLVASCLWASAVFAEEVKLDKEETIKLLSSAVATLIKEQKEIKKEIEYIKNNTNIFSNSPTAIGSENTSYVVVSEGLIHAREAISKDAIPTKAYRIGDIVSGKKIDSKWLLIEKIGYLEMDSVKKIDKDSLITLVLKQKKNLRLKPSSDNEYYHGSLKKGDKVRVYDFPVVGKWHLTENYNFIYRPRD